MKCPDEEFPALSAMARSNGHSLRALTEEADLGDENRVLTLREWCYLWMREDGPWPSYYLGTLEQFVRSIPMSASPAKALWHKLAAPRSSEFLDTVVEAAWYLHLSKTGSAPKLEEPFLPNEPSAGNADFVITRGDRTYWLDSTSINPSELDPPNECGFVPSASRAAALFANRARRKYDRKFRKHVEAGRLNGAYVGILLCVLKGERVVLPPLLFGHESSVPPPVDLFDDRYSALVVVAIHSLRADAGGILRPLSHLLWARSKDHEIAGV
jgi:hypothetical protein